MSSSDNDSFPDEEEEHPEDWDDWTEDEDDDGCDPVKALFSETILPSAEAALDHDAQSSGFDLRAYKRQVGMNEYDVIRCINYIRKEVAAGKDPRPALQQAVNAAVKPWADDSFLLPALPEDPLLFHDFEEAEAGDAPANSSSTATKEAAEQLPEPAAQQQIQSLQEENEMLKFLVAELRQTTMPIELVDDLAATSINDPSAPGTSYRTHTYSRHTPWGRGPQEAPSTSQGRAPSNNSKAPHPLSGGEPRTQVQRVDQTYFESYSYFGIHRDMLSDKARTEAYQHALEKNPKLVKGATVLDVGCGTGILSMFAARGGAERVVGVDGSERIAGIARQVLDANGLGLQRGGPVSVVAGKLEDLKELPVQQVDVIVSEWMGYALLFETMLETVLYARDKYLKPGGAVLPDKACIYMAAATEGAMGLDFWKDVYGFSMEPIRATLVRSANGKAQVQEVRAADIASRPVMLQELDMCTMTADQQDFSTTFLLEPVAPPPAEAGTPEAPQSQEVAALVIWFDTLFSDRFCSEHPVVLSTSPFEATTHWAQTVLPLRFPLRLGRGQGAASSIKGRLSMVRSVKHRGLDISVEYDAVVEGGEPVHDVLLFNMDIHSEGEPSA